MSVRHAARYRVPCAFGLDVSCRCTMVDAHLQVSIAHNASDIVGTFQGAETGTVQDVTILRVAHDAAYTGITVQVVFAIEDEVGNDGMCLQRTLRYAHKAQTVGTLIAIADAANTVTIAIEHALERMVGGA